MCVLGRAELRELKVQFSSDSVQSTSVFSPQHLEQRHEQSGVVFVAFLDGTVITRGPKSNGSQARAYCPEQEMFDGFPMSKVKGVGVIRTEDPDDTRDDLGAPVDLDMEIRLDFTDVVMNPKLKEDDEKDAWQKLEPHSCCDFLLVVTIKIGE